MRFITINSQEVLWTFLHYFDYIFTFQNFTDHSEMTFPITRKFDKCFDTYSFSDVGMLENLLQGVSFLRFILNARLNQMHKTFSHLNSFGDTVNTFQNRVENLLLCLALERFKTEQNLVE